MQEAAGGHHVFSNKIVPVAKRRQYPKELVRST